MIRHSLNVSVCLFLFALCACGEKAEAPSAAPAELVAQVAQQQERAKNEQLAKEEARRLHSEEQRKREKAEEEAGLWKTIGLVAVLAAIAMTLVGVAIGSSARKQAERARRDD